MMTYVTPTLIPSVKSIAAQSAIERTAAAAPKNSSAVDHSAAARDQCRTGNDYK
jgi:hypothetical protein